jgi:hypothetical protein
MAPFSLKSSERKWPQRRLSSTVPLYSVCVLTFCLVQLLRKMSFEFAIFEMRRSKHFFIIPAQPIAVHTIPLFKDLRGWGWTTFDPLSPRQSLCLKGQATSRWGGIRSVHQSPLGGGGGLERGTAEVFFISNHTLHKKSVAFRGASESALFERGHARGQIKVGPGLRPAGWDRVCDDTLDTESCVQASSMEAGRSQRPTLTAEYEHAASGQLFWGIPYT